MKKIYSWIIDKWLAGFITASVFFILKLYIELPENLKSNFLNFKWLKEIFNMQIPLYFAILIVFFLIIITRFEKSRLKIKYTSPKTNKNDTPYNHYKNYKSDIFGIKKSKWSWDYKWLSHRQSFEITDLKPNCPVCDTTMDLDDYNYQLADCHKCRLDGKKYTFRISENISDISKEIIRKIKKDEVLA
ncbi:hypothetical protein [Flavobacterium johnsoniae]|uniref:Uncharacterized protein n=1 Tax=Flavobacterium johnsoniae TaxID=986 RepID=A0A1J7BVV8_FLAJO|nr:hypothetical protein [Flavobacterium johnsoniae]OIV42757.1 hypothetical protein BKM63_07755 [Flavobacterium johnsoniae]